MVGDVAEVAKAPPACINRTRDKEFRFNLSFSTYLGSLSEKVLFLIPDSTIREQHSQCATSLVNRKLGSYTWSFFGVLWLTTVPACKRFSLQNSSAGHNRFACNKRFRYIILSSTAVIQVCPSGLASLVIGQAIPLASSDHHPSAVRFFLVASLPWFHKYCKTARRCWT